MKIGTIVAAIVGGFVLFSLGGLLFGWLLADYFKANTIEYAGLMKDPPILWMVYLFNVVWAWLIAFLLDYAGRSGGVQGAIVGAAVMFALSLGMNIEFEAFMNIHKGIAPMLVHLVVLTLMGVIAGAAIGGIMGFFGKKVEA